MQEIESSLPAFIIQTRPRFVWWGPSAQNKFCCMDSYEEYQHRGSEEEASKSRVLQLF